MPGMSFETNGQEWFGKAVSGLGLIAVYAVGFVALMYFIDACGPERKAQECVCECGGSGR